LDRFVRQRTLAQVGDAGQERIATARYAVDEATPAGAVQRDYLERAGARHFEAPPSPQAAFRHAEAFRSRVARDFAEGAWRALEQIQKALEQAP
jgi:hypothetical protein